MKVLYLNSAQLNSWGYESDHNTQIRTYKRKNIHKPLQRLLVNQHQ